ncbi:caspase family protein [Rhizobium sp. 25PS6]|uniref:caspase family protein n=1 Tax=Rhizobium sp. 25PS6 TaxID=3075622 RepID=UPI0028FD6445|nr:caspase family protein [Rhizobium sp. 25PS6]MDU0359786.1 caspase family protein [Rhizobium sp. 25PS6]
MKTASASEEVRELQRKLLVLGELSGFVLDGKDSRALRDTLARFASHHNEHIANDEEAGALLDRVLEEKTREAVGPYDSPQPFDRPSFSDDWFVSLVVAPEDNLVLAGSCDNIARFRLDTGVPARGLAQASGYKFAYSSARKEIVCLARWDDKRNGLLIVDARTGMRKDFIILSGMLDFAHPELTIATTGATAWVLGKEGIWIADLAKHAAHQAVQTLPDNLPEKIEVSSDGSLVAIEFSHVKKGFTHEIRTYDASTGRQLSAVFDLEDLSLAPLGDRYLAKKDDSYQIRDARTGKSLYSKNFEVDTPGDELAFTSDGSGLLFSGGDNDATRSVLRWDFSSGGLTTVSHFGQTGNHVHIDEERGEVYTVGSDGVFRYRLATGEALTPSSAINRTGLAGAAVGPDGSVAVGIAGATAYILETESGQVRQLATTDCTVDKSPIQIDDGDSVAFSGHGRVALACNEGSIKELDLQTGKVTPVGKFADDQADDLKVSPDGFYIAAVYSDLVAEKLSHTLIVAERNSGRILVRKTSEALFAMGFVDGGRRILYGDGHFAVVQDVASGKTVTRLELRLETKKSGRTTSWHWGRVHWVLPDAESGDSLLGVTVGLGGVGGLVYGYAGGKFTLLDGKLIASSNSLTRFATAGRVSRLHEDRLVSIQAEDEPAIGSLNAEKWTSKHARSGGNVLALGPQKEGRFVVVTDVGGMLLYDEKMPNPIMTTVLSEEGNWLTRIDGGYFAGTRGAGENLFLAPSLNETITIDSFFNSLYRPDLVASVASGNAPEQKAESDPTINTLLKDGLPPSVAILSPAGNTVADKESIIAKATLTPSTGGIGRLEWRVNGIVRVARTLSSGVGVRQGEPIDIDDSLLLEPGDNIIELSVFNASNGIASTPASTKISWIAAGTSASPRLFVLAVGVNRYWDSTLTLKFAANDAADMVHSFELAGADLFDGVRTWLVTDEKATRSGINLVFDDIAKQIRSTDVFVLFVAGHGKTEDGRYYFIPYDFKYAGGTVSIAEQGIDQDDWQIWLARVATRKSLLMFDTCESGTLTLERTTRGLSRLAALDRLTRATGRSVLAASSDDGPALEGFQDHGVFAYTVMEGLGAADPARTGLIQVTALASYVGVRVPELSFGKFGIRQVPQMKLIGEDFAVGKTVNVLANPAQGFVPVQPTHVVISSAVITNAQGSASGEPLSPGTLVRVVGVSARGSEVARDGKRLGFVPTATLAPMQ